MNEISQARAEEVLMINDIAAQDDLASFLEYALANDLRGKDQNGRNLLHTFCHFKALRCATYLISLYPSLAKEKDVMGEIPLHRACYGKNISKNLITSLLHLSDINAQNVFGATPLYYAATTGTREGFDFLTEQGADATLTDKQGRAPSRPEN